MPLVIDEKFCDDVITELRTHWMRGWGMWGQEGTSTCFLGACYRVGKRRQQTAIPRIIDQLIVPPVYEKIRELFPGCDCEYCAVMGLTAPLTSMRTRRYFVMQFNDKYDTPDRLITVMEKLRADL